MTSVVQINTKPINLLSDKLIIFLFISAYELINNLQRVSELRVYVYLQFISLGAFITFYRFNCDVCNLVMPGILSTRYHSP